MFYRLLLTALDLGCEMEARISLASLGINSRRFSLLPRQHSKRKPSQWEGFLFEWLGG